MWYEQFIRAYGIHPRNYLCFDCETTGLSTEYDLPVQIGHCLVRDGAVIHKGSYYINWLKHPAVSRADLARKLDLLAERFQQQGRTYHITLSTLLSDGVEPGEALSYYLHLFRTAEENGNALVGHNIIRFDWPLLFNTFLNYADETWEVLPRSLWDVGVIEKARQLELQPEPSEPFLAYQKRAGKAFGRNVLWNAASCVERYKLAERHNLDVAQLHDAEFDSYVTHLLCEAQRELFAAQCPAKPASKDAQCVSP